MWPREMRGGGCVSNRLSTLAHHLLPGVEKPSATATTFRRITCVLPCVTQYCVTSTSTSSARCRKPFSKHQACSHHPRYSMTSYWSDACTRATGTSLQALLDAVHGSCGTTVIRAAADTETACKRLRCALMLRVTLANRSPHTASAHSRAAFFFVVGCCWERTGGSTCGGFMDGSAG